MTTPNTIPNTMLTTILAITANLIGLLCSLVMIVMFLAGSANASPAVIDQMKWLHASVVLVQLLALSSSVAMLYFNRGWFACGAALLPIPFAIVLVTVLVVMEW